MYLILIDSKILLILYVFRLDKKFHFYTTKELKTPTVNTNNNQRLKPEKTRPLFSVQPFGEAKTTGTPTTKANDTTIKANKAS